MPQRDNNFYVFGDFRLDAIEHALYQDDNLIPLTPKAVETLLVLVRHAGHIVSKEELIQAVWPDTFVEEGNLNVNISVLRKALGETGSEHSFIETVPRRGYRFVAPVRLLPAERGELILEKTTRAQIVTEEVTEGSRELLAVSAPEIPWQGEERRHTTRIISAASTAALPAARVVRFSRWLLLAGVVVAGVVLFAAGRRYLSSRPDPPVRVSLADKKLIAWDAKNRVSWEYDFPQPAEFQTVQGQPYSLFMDLVGDGHRELLALLNLRAENPVVSAMGGNLPGGYYHSFLHFFSDKGRLLWSYSPDFKLSFSGHFFEGPWTATAMTLTPAASGQTIWVAYRHHTWWPSFVTRIDARGAASLAFVNSGHLWFLASVRNSTGDYVLAGGTNNDLGSAILAVLGDNEQVSATPQPLARGPYAYDNWLRAPHLYFVFSPSEVFRLSGALYHSIQSIVVEPDRIQVNIYEGKDPRGGANYLQGYYDFTKDFALKSATLGDLYWQAHGLYESQGKIRHSASHCPDRSIGSTLREYTGAGGWLAPNPTTERPAN